METAIGLILGIVATVLVSRYYFLRSVDKRITIYTMLDSLVFSGIEPDVKRQLNFIFQGRQVEDLQQLIFLVANSGERAVSNILEPLSLDLPSEVEVLDASMLYRSPVDLAAKITHSSTANGTKVQLNFPLLNKSEFLVVRLLLSGSIKVSDMKFNILADDIPRSLCPQFLPRDAIRDKKYKVDWSLVVGAVCVLLIPAWICYFAFLLWGYRPGLFPYPWTTFHVSLGSIAFVLLGTFVILLTSGFGAAMLGAAFFNGQFPPKRGPHFSLPKDLQGLSFPYRYLMSDFGSSDDLKINS